MSYLFSLKTDDATIEELITDAIRLYIQMAYAQAQEEGEEGDVIGDVDDESIPQEGDETILPGGYIEMDRKKRRKRKQRIGFKPSPSHEKSPIKRKKGDE